MNMGTFGLGFARIGTGGIQQRENVQGTMVELGEIGYYWLKLSLAYR